MKPIDIFFILLLALPAFLAIRYVIRRRRSGKSSCGGSCAGCGGCDLPKRKEEKEHGSENQ